MRTNPTRLRPLDQTSIEVWCGRCDAAGRRTQLGIVLRDQVPTDPPALWQEGRPFPDQEIVPVIAGAHLIVVDTPVGQRADVHCPKCSRELGKAYSHRMKVERFSDALQELEGSGGTRGIVLVTGDRQLVPRSSPASTTKSRRKVSRSPRR